jgi:uncharacterized protein YcbK (DUF882 family)
MSTASPWSAAPELKRLRKELARKRREPIRIIITTDPTRPVRTLTIPRYLPLVLLAAATVLVIAAVGLSFTTWSLRGHLAKLRGRAVAMMQMADNLALRPQGIAHAGMFPRGQGLAPLLHKPGGTQGRFAIESANASEQVDVVFDLATGDMDADAYRALRHLMRCRRTGAEIPIDPRLVELLYGLSQRTGQKIVLISGYRAPGFAAPNSYHIRGMAADIRIPGMTALMVRDLARAMGVRGIGYYPRSQFVHVDLRDEPYFWTDLGTGEGSADPEMEGDTAELAGKNGRIPDP